MRFTYNTLRAAQAKWKADYCNNNQHATPANYIQLGQLQTVARLALTRGTLNKDTLEELLDTPVLNFVIHAAFSES